MTRPIAGAETPMPSQDAETQTNAMTAAAVSAEVRSIAAIFGLDAYVSASVSASKHSSDNVIVSVYPNDITNSRTSESFRAPTWREALDAARTWSLSQGTVHCEAAIRRMALLIVDLTDQHGECTEAMLVRQEFSRKQVHDLHALACVRADEMCQGAPFSVKLA